MVAVSLRPVKQFFGDKWCYLHLHVDNNKRGVIIRYIPIGHAQGEQSLTEFRLTGFVQQHDQLLGQDT